MPYLPEIGYTSDLIHPYQVRLLEDITANRPLVFARDLVYYLSRKYQRNFSPLYCKNYTIHPRSPLTTSIRHAVDLLLRKMDPVYAFNYFDLIALEGEHRLAQFIATARSVFARFTELEKRSASVLFDLVLYVARLGVECEIRGVRDASHLTVVLINIFLVPLEKEVFVLLHQHALDIIELCKERPPGGASKDE